MRKSHSLVLPRRYRPQVQHVLICLVVFGTSCLTAGFVCSTTSTSLAVHHGRRACARIPKRGTLMFFARLPSCRGDGAGKENRFGRVFGLHSVALELREYVTRLASRGQRRRAPRGFKTRHPVNLPHRNAAYRMRFQSQIGDGLETIFETADIPVAGARYSGNMQQALSDTIVDTVVLSDDLRHADVKLLVAGKESHSLVIKFLTRSHRAVRYRLARELASRRYLPHLFYRVAQTPKEWELGPGEKCDDDDDEEDEDEDLSEITNEKYAAHELENIYADFRAAGDPKREEFDNRYGSRRNMENLERLAEMREFKAAKRLKLAAEKKDDREFEKEFLSKHGTPEIDPHKFLKTFAGGQKLKDSGTPMPDEGSEMQEGFAARWFEEPI